MCSEGCCSRLSVCVYVSVCLSVKLHLTSGVSVRPENTVTYSAGKEGQNIVGFSLKTLQHCSVESICTARHFPFSIYRCRDMGLCML